MCGWKKIKTKFCQIVSVKNRVAHVIFARFCLDYKNSFDYSIFLDECTVEMCHEPRAIWFKERPNKIKLVGKYQHEASVHILGAISRRGRSKLMIFTRNLNANGFQIYVTSFYCNSLKMFFHYFIEYTWIMLKIMCQMNLKYLYTIV